MKTKDKNKPEEFVESKEMREQYLEKAYVLQKVKKLITLPNTELMTTRMVSEWYEVDMEVMKKVVKRFNEELSTNGMTFKKHSDIKRVLKRDNISPLGISPRGSYVFTLRAVLNVGMLLRDSEIAKEVRSQLLNVYEESSDEQKVKSINEEQMMLLNIIQSSSTEDRALALSEYNEYKNRHINKLEKELEEQEPKVSYYDKILSSSGSLNITQIAKDYGMTAQALNKLLHEEGVQFKQAGQWLLYKEHQGRGYTKTETFLYADDETGEKHGRMRTKWTQRGRLFIHELLESKGIKANMDE